MQKRLISGRPSVKVCVEAFAAQSLAVMDEWGMDPEDERLIPNGGVIFLGHPLGCSGTRILTTLVREMKRRDEVQYGLATICIGVGQGIAMVVEKVQNAAAYREENTWYSNRKARSVATGVIPKVIHRTYILAISRHACGRPRSRSSSLRTPSRR